MKKITTLFKKDPNNLGRVINEVHPDNEWVKHFGIPTRKYDATSCAIIKGKLYKRFDLKKGRTLPTSDAIPCQEPDPITGHHPHWVICRENDNSNKYHFEAFKRLKVEKGFAPDGTYELCGEKVQGNPENIIGHQLIPHGDYRYDFINMSFEYIKKFLEENDIEGIVFYHMTDDRMCKIRKKDFGIKRKPIEIKEVEYYVINNEEKLLNNEIYRNLIKINTYKKANEILNGHEKQNKQ